MNCLCVSGNIGKDAVVRKAGEQSVAGFSLAMKSGYGEKAQTIWLDCSLWGKQAESGLVQYLKKGQFVVLSGELGTREHEGKTYLTLRVNDVTLGGKSEQTNQQQQPQQQAQQPYNYNQQSPTSQHGYQQSMQPQQNRQPPQGYQGQMPQQQFAPQQYQNFDEDQPF
jgi:single-strand DNA-binding protein